MAGRFRIFAFSRSSVIRTGVFFMVSDASDTSTIFLAAGFVGLLLLDAMFQAWGLAPRWWLRLRVMLTVVVLGCIAIPLQA